MPLFPHRQPHLMHIQSFRKWSARNTTADKN
uniref:Uncharacterized protein n=1 Tax=Romanomermis culicivorax TaxID=13658 RepID=A0A915IRJ7_ROMCU